MNPLGLSLVATIILSPAAEPTPDQLLTKMRSTYAALASANYTLEATVPGHGNGPIKTNVFWKPDSFKARAFIGSGREAVITTEGKVMIIKGGMSVDRRVPLSSRSLLDAFPCNLETVVLLEPLRQLDAQNGAMKGSTLKVATKPWEGANWLVLNESVAGTGSFDYYVHPTSMFIMRAVAKDAQGALRGDYVIRKLKVTRKS
jgi:hypothetical protein